MNYGMDQKGKGFHMRFVGIWFDLDQEVKRDYVDAKDSSDASEKINSLYAGKEPPAPCLTILVQDSKKNNGSSDLNGFYMKNQW